VTVEILAYHASIAWKLLFFGSHRIPVRA
jgi:hypothetical protein